MLSSLASGLTRAHNTANNHSKYVEVGDQVRVRYLTGGDVTVLVKISDRFNDPNNGVVIAHEPLAKAILGAEVGDEIEILVGRYVRKAVIEDVSKAGAK